MEGQVPGTAVKTSLGIPISHTSVARFEISAVTYSLFALPLSFPSLFQSSFLFIKCKPTLLVHFLFEREGDTRRELPAMVHASNARQPFGPSQEHGTSSRSPTGMSGAQVLELPHSVLISRKLNSGAAPGPKSRPSGVGSGHPKQ